MQTADVTLSTSNLQALVDAVRLSRRTMLTIRQNLFFALVYNRVGIPLAAGLFYPWLGVMLPPMFAAAAMALSSVSVVSNSLRPKRFQWNCQQTRIVNESEGCETVDAIIARLVSHY